MQALIEVLLSLVFLAGLLYLGYLMLTQSNAFMFKMYAILTLLMGATGGIYFLIHGIYQWTSGAFVYGKLSGIAMLFLDLAVTVVFFGLFTMITQRYRIQRATLNYTVYVFMAFRIVLLLLPQNSWFEEGGSTSLVIVQLLCLIAVGALVILLSKAKAGEFSDRSFDKLYLFVGFLLATYVVYSFLKVHIIPIILLLLGMGALVYYLYMDFRQYQAKRK